MKETIIILSLIVPLAIVGASVLVTVVEFFESRRLPTWFIWIFSTCFALLIVLLGVMIIDYYCIIFGIEDVFELRE